MSPPVSESFKRRAPAAAFWEAWVGSVLTRGGLYVTLHPWTIDGEDHSQSYDLDVWVRWCCDEPDSKQVEVKSLNVDFSRPDNYPYDPVLVCSQSNYLKKFPLAPHFGESLESIILRRNFLFVSRVTGAILWLPAGSLVSGGHEVRDSERGDVYKAIVASKQALRPVSEFIEMVSSP